MPTNDGVFKVQFHNTNLALKIQKWYWLNYWHTCDMIKLSLKCSYNNATKMPKWATKMLRLATC